MVKMTRFLKPQYVYESVKTSQLWEVCIGLEVHAQISSKSKLFSRSSTAKNQPPNSCVSLYDMALPGTLPTLNEHCVAQTIKSALAMNSHIQNKSIFERKHYFYSDLPLGYQITQQRAPIATAGFLTIPTRPRKIQRIPTADHMKEHNMDQFADGQNLDQHDGGRNVDAEKKIRINRIQIEQDSGKSIHDLEPESTLIDLNRAGTALMEIVMEPDLRSPEDAGQVLRQLQHLLRHLGTCDGNMEEGSMRCDLNVSVRRVIDEMPEQQYGERVEVKNMNSIRNLIRAADFEAKRQIVAIEETGLPIEKETRGFDASTGMTVRMRSKEGAKDYRFFPEPDLPPLVLPVGMVESVRTSMPEMPDALRKRLRATYGLSDYESSVLVQESDSSKYFEEVASATNRPHKLVVNWVLNDLFSLLKETNSSVASSPISPERLGGLLDLIINGTISGKIAKETLPIMFYEDRRSALEIVEEKGWIQISDPSKIKSICQNILTNSKHQKNVLAYQNGKTKLFGYFIGQVMKECGGKVHPELTNKIMKDLLEHK